SLHRDHDERIDTPARLGNPLTGRVILSLALASLLPGLVLGVFIAATASFDGKPHVGILIAWATGTELLALVGGSLAVILVGKGRTVGRAQCLWIGTGVSLLLPLAASCAGSVVGHFAGVTLDLTGER